MSRRLAVVVVLFFPIAASAAAPPARGVDIYGDPLPLGAVARLGTVRFRGPWVQCLAYTPDGKQLVSGSMDGQVRVWDPRTGKELRAFRTTGEPALALAFDPPGRLLATSPDLGGRQGDFSICLWDFATGRLVRRLKGHTA